MRSENSLFVCPVCMGSKASRYSTLVCNKCNCQMQEISLNIRMDEVPNQKVKYMSEANNVVSVIRHVREAHQTGVFTQGLWYHLVQWRGVATIAFQNYLVEGWAETLDQPPATWDVVGLA